MARFVFLAKRRLGQIVETFDHTYNVRRLYDGTILNVSKNSVHVLTKAEVDKINSNRDNKIKNQIDKVFEAFENTQIKLNLK